MKKNVLITGASGNLGKATVEKFLAEGYKVFMTIAPGEILRYTPTGDVEIFEVVLDDEVNVQQQLSKTFDKVPTLDATLMLAGGYSPGTLETTTGSALDTAISQNFKTTYYITQFVFKKMIAQPGGGRMVMIGARPALRAKDGKNSLAYALSKSMVIKLAEFVNAAGAEKNVVATVVIPSTLDTPANRSAMPKADFSSWVKLEDVAEMMAVFVSSKAQAVREPVIKMYGGA